MLETKESFSPIVAKAGRMLLPLGLVALVAVGIAVGAWQFILAPAEERLTRSQAAYQGALQNESRLEAARKTQEDLAVVWAELPVRKDFASLAASISGLAKTDQVEVPGMSYGLQKVEDGLPVKATLTFQAVGEYAAIRRFIYRLEMSGPYLFIESLDAARAAGRPAVNGRRSPALVVFHVQVVTFLRQDPVPSRGTT